MVSEQIRTFIAIELTNEVKYGLNRLQTQLKSEQYTFVKWVAPGGIHMTLKFLGNVHPEKVSKVTKVVEQAVAGVSAFKVVVKDVGGFPNLKQPRVLWVGIGGDIQKLIDLQQRIDNDLMPLGFAKEKRSFTPHLTLARLREGVSAQDRQEFGAKIEAMAPKLFYEMVVGSINVMKSQLLSTGAIYSRLSELKLH